MTSHTTLLLNSTYEPMKVISWKKAISLWWNSKVEIVEEYSDYDLKSVSFTMKCPAVVRLLSYVKGSKTCVKFSRLNVFSRDNFACQYCGVQPGTSRLTYDHVLPKSRGGKTTWENIVTACVPCNNKKDDRTPAEAKMRLRKSPVKPKERPYVSLTLNLPRTPKAWGDYLHWASDMSKDSS